MAVRSILPADRDFLFNPSNTLADMPSQLVDANLVSVVAHNPRNKPIKIKRRSRVGYIQEADFTSACLTSPAAAALCLPQRPRKAAHWQPEPADTLDNRTTLPNGVVVFGGRDAVDKLRTVVDQYDIWAYPGRKPSLVNIPPDRWMRLPLLPNAKLPKTQIYKVGTESKKCIDDIFDTLHDEGKMSWA